MLQLKVCPPQLRDPVRCTKPGGPVCRRTNELFPKHQRHYTCPSARGGPKNDSTARHGSAGHEEDEARAPCTDAGQGLRPQRVSPTE